MSVGTYLHLAAKGPQETLMYGTDPGGPFSSCYKRHTRYAIDTKELVFPDGCVFGKDARLVIPRDGDMLGDIVLEFHLPAVPGAAPTDRWVDAIGYVLFRRIRCVIDDIEISNTERLWYDIADRLFLKESHKAGVDAMIGRNRVLPLTRSHVIYVPLKLFSCKAHRETQNFFPLLTAPGSTMSLTLELESFANCVTSYAGSLPPTQLKAHALVDYVVLEPAERERMINRPHTLLIDAEQDAEELTYKEFLSMDGGDARVPVDTVKIDLSEVNYPVKYIVWVVYANSALASKAYFTYLDEIKETRLLLDGNERFSSQDGGYFQLVEHFFKGRRVTAADGVYLYSFALDAASWQPCGHLTFGEVGKPVLDVTLKEKRSDRVVKAFIVGSKFVDIARGRVTVRYS